ncbi:MAG: rRNA cytosine-C5-methyltransferase [Bacteroidia bacterium]|nr:rRNA cytosine-C5-methyltransferase [Bacteroidia bacterium]
MKLPDAFLEKTRDLLGEEAEALFSALEEPSPVSIRLNPFKPAVSVSGTKVPWSSFGHYLPERPAFTFDPLLHAGCYYVQEASSMFMEKALNQVVEMIGSQSLNVLDLCAAPGGKSTLLASCLPDDSLLVANELNRLRANILAENLIKWGLPNVVTTQSDATAFSVMTEFFDVVLTDVPCSGEGMFRKDPDSVGEWSVDHVKLCASRQREIVGNIWSSLKPGGFLIYSTCTYNITENEENVQWICSELGGELVRIPLDQAWGISGALGLNKELAVNRFFPHRTKGEGFFLALIQKEGEHENGTTFVKSVRTKHSSGKKATIITTEIKQLLMNSGRTFSTVSSGVGALDDADFGFFADRQGRICAFPSNHLASLRRLEENIRVVHAGIVLGEIKGKDLLPDPSLALSVSLNRDVVQSFDLNKKQAIDYLRREAITLPVDCPLGWVLMCFEGHPLGWMKNIGNRANNGYPIEWRIRSENPF